MGLGEPAQARAFRARTGWEGPVLVDGEGLAYRAVALRRTTVWRLLRPALWRAGWRARREGHRQTGTQGDPWQLGGTLVVAPGGRLLYAHRNAGPEDEAPVEDVVAALRGARA